MLTEQNGIQVDKFYPPTDWQYSFPEGYTRLEYLESSGTQYIDTGVNGSCSFKIVAQGTLQNNVSQIVLGCNNTKTNYFGKFGTRDTWGFGDSNGVNFDELYITKQEFLLVFSNNSLSVTCNGVTKTTTGTSTLTNNMYLFGGNATNKYLASCKIFSCIIKDENNNLLRNFVPVKRNSDNKPGMYDLVNNVFYVNQGTGEFVMGPELYSNNSQIDIRQKNNTNFVEKYKFNENNELIWANPQLNLSGPVNYSVVGNPTIEDGVASGFSTSNYIRIFDIYTQPINSLNFVVKINSVPTTITNNASVISLRGPNNVYVYVNGNNKITLSYKNKSGSTNYLNSGSTTTIGYYKFILNNTGSYMYYSTDNIVWTLLNSFTTESTIPNLSTITFGVNIGYLSTTYNVYDGSIDLKETYIKVNDKLWFYGKNYTSQNYAPVPAGLNCKIKGPISYTVVGSPTITDGVVSGFSASDYLKIQNLGEKISTANKWEFVTKIHTSLTNSGQCIFGNNVDWGTNVRINSENQLILNVSNTTTSADIGSITGLTVLSDDTDYYVKVEFTGTQYILSLSIDGTAWSNEGYINSSTKITNRGDWLFGMYSVSAWYFRGSIDMNETYIKINNKLWFGTQQTTPSIGYVNTQTQVFIPAPEGSKYSQTRDIKVIPPEDNTITLLYGVKSDFSKYSLFGLLANTSSGTYDVYIDDVLYATTTKNTQTDIDFSTLGSEYVSIGTCTTPESLVLHKIVIKPTTNGETITRFACRRTTGTTGTQQQGILWANLQLENNLTLSSIFGSESAYNNRILYAVTAKNNKIIATSTSTNTTGLYSIYARCVNLIYSPILEYNTKDYINGVYLTFDQTQLKRVTIKNNPSIDMTIIRNALQLEKIDIENLISLRSGTASGNSAQNAYKLKILPKYETETQTCDNINMFNIESLYPTKINDSTNKLREFLRIYGSSTYPMRCLRGLKVSNEAPFTGTSPQIDVSYTGLDRDALIELFNSMPGYMKLNKVGEPTIDSNGVTSGFSSGDYLIINNFQKSVNFSGKIRAKLNAENSGYSSLFRFQRTTPNQRFSIENQNTTNVRIYHYNESIGSNSVNTIYTLTLGDVWIDYIFDYDRVAKTINIKAMNINDNSTIFEITYDNCVLDNIDYVQFGYMFNAWNGSIDFKNSYIIINNTRYQFQLPDDTTTRAINITAATGNNLTKVGNVVIDANGVASGFSSSDYLSISSFTPSLNTNTRFKVYIKFNITNTISSACNICGISSWYAFGIIIGDNKNIRGVSNINNQYYYCNSDVIVQLNTTYYCIFEIDVTKGIQTLGVSTDNINFSYFDTEITKQNYITNASIGYKFGYGSYGTFNGSIDLENTYVKVGNNYIMKGYLTDNDRLIATNKGWTITG